MPMVLSSFHAAMDEAPLLVCDDGAKAEAEARRAKAGMIFMVNNEFTGGKRARATAAYVSTAPSETLKIRRQRSRPN